MKNDKILFVGEIIETLPNATFRVELEGGIVILGYLAGKMRQHYIKVVTGDWVEIEISPYDPTKGRIVKRLSNPDAKRLSREKKEKNKKADKAKQDQKTESNNHDFTSDNRDNHES